MEYAQLNEEETEAAQITTNGNVEWDSDHLCPASALTIEESDKFRVVPLFATNPTAVDSIYQSVIRDGCIFNNDRWEYKWRVDALPPDQIQIKLSNKIGSVLRKIDLDADLIYSEALGNRATEYAQAEKDATAYRDAGYAGEVPEYVQAWALATGKSSQWAADSILSTAQSWRNAQAAIRLNRLICKELAKKATTSDEFDSVEAQWAGFVVAIKTQLGIS